MPLFDIIETSGKAYIRVWHERAFFMRLALVPFITKVLFFAVVVILGFQDNIFRQTLIMLPAYFMEGWMIAHIMRCVFLGEKWPVKLSGNTEKDVMYLADRGKAIFAAIILYVLIKMGQNALLFPIIEGQQEIEKFNKDNPPGALSFFVAFILIFALLWSFKLMFLHLPVAVNIAVKSYLFKMQGIVPSLYLLGAWLTCYVPFVLVGGFLASLITPVFGSNEDMLVMSFVIIHFAVDIIALTVISVCFSIALKHIFSQSNPGHGEAQ